MKKTLLLFVNIFTFGLLANAQCVTSSSYGSAAPINGNTITISTCNYLSEYSTISGIVAGESYEFTVNNGYITVYQDGVSTNLLGHASGSVIVTALTSGNLYAHWNANAACGTASSCQVTTVRWSSWAPPTCPDPTGLSSSLISATEFNLNWTTGGASNWIVEYGTSGFVRGTGTIVSVSANDSLVISGLTANTTYQWYVRDFCGVGDSSFWVGPNSFYTGYCIPTASSSTTYINSFTTTNGVTNISNLASGFTPGGYKDNYAIHSVSAQASTSFNFSTEVVGGTLGTAIWIDWNNNLVFEASERVFNTTSYANNQTGVILVPASTLIGDYRMRVMVDYLTLNPVNPCYQTTRMEVEDYKLTVLAAPTCPVPTVASTSNITAFTADLNWITGGSTDWLVEYGLTGFTPGSGTLVSFTAGDSLYLSGLTPNTAYQWYVSDFCSIGDTSLWVGPKSFTTLVTCPAPSGLSATIVSTTEVNLNWTTGGSTEWLVEYGITGFTPGTGTVVSVSLDDSLNISGLTPSTSYQWYVVDFCGIADTSVRVGPNSFYTGHCIPSASSSLTYISNFSTTNGYANISHPSLFTVGGYENNYNTDFVSASEGSSFNFSMTIVGGTAGAAIWVDWNKDLVFDASERVYNYNGYGSGPFSGVINVPSGQALGDYTMRVVTHYNASNPTNPCDNGTRLEFEDYKLTVSLVPTCFAPTAVSLSNLTSSSADLSWTTGGATEWEVEYGVVGFAIGTGTTESVSTTAALSLTSLLSDTPYDVYIRDYCSVGDSSAWTIFKFRTQCDTYTVPYFEGFESGYADQAFVAGCLTQESEAGASAWIANNSQTSNNRGPNTGSFSAYLQWSNTDWIFIPIQLSAGVSYTAQLYARQDGVNTANSNMTISYGNAPNAAAMTNSIVGPVGINNVYQLISGEFIPDTTGVYYVGIKGFMNSSPYYISLDDIRIDLTPACPTVPSNLASTTVSFSEVNLNWTTGGATDWVVEYGPAGFAHGDGTIASVSGTSTLNVTGLLAETVYDWYVRDYCGGIDSGYWIGAAQFFTGYCTPAPTSTDGGGISNVTMGSINNTTGAEVGNYGNYSSLVTTVGQGTTLPISVTLGYNYGIWAWIDWNNDLDFDDAGEFVFLGESTSGNPSFVNASIVVPANASLGTHRIRIGGSDFNHSASSSHDPCYVGSYGSFEDYTLNVVECNIPNTVIEASFCQGESVTVGANVYNAAGTYYDTLTVAFGCDSIIVYDITELLASTSSQDFVFCEGDSITLPNGIVVFAGGVYTETLTNAIGCDSVISYNVVMNLQSSSLTNVFLCNGDSYTLPNGTVVSLAGTYDIDETNALGCDSTASFVVTTGVSTVETLDISFCAGDSVMLADGSYASTVGTVIVTSLNASGCDNVITYNVTEIAVSSGTLAASICAGNTYMFDGQPLTVAGVYTMVETNALGCDSVVELTLTVLALAESTTSASICAGDSYMWNGVAETIAGTYTLTDVAANGCDSIATLILEVNPVYNNAVAASICDGDVYAFDGLSLTTAGVYTANDLSVFGCDSVTVLTLTLNPVYNNAIAASICDGDTYAFDGLTLTAAGVYTANDLSVFGCDSVTVLTLTVNPVYNNAVAASICDGDVYAFDGLSLTTAGVYTANDLSVFGCDSVTVLTLTLNPVYNNALAASICDGDVYAFDGLSLTTAGVYTANDLSVFGCDSVTVLTLTVNPVYNNAIAESICDGATFMFDGQAFTTSGVYTANDLSVLGCDSVTVLTLTVNSILTANEVVDLCSGNAQFVLSDGTVVRETGVYESTAMNEDGCNVLTTYNVTACVGIFNVENNVAMLVYPNPAKDKVNVNFDEKLNSENNISILNVLGQAVYSISNFEGLTLEVNTSTLTDGVYYINVTTNNKTSVVPFVVAK